MGQLKIVSQMFTILILFVNNFLFNYANIFKIITINAEFNSKYITLKFIKISPVVFV